MCIACELGLMLALGDLPERPPPGFPRGKPAEDPARFACDAPSEKVAPPAEDKPKP